MILLIPAAFLAIAIILFSFKFHYDSINSSLKVITPPVLGQFKFHYDSINSVSESQINIVSVEFKFHYDSINSRSSLNTCC